MKSSDIDIDVANREQVLSGLKFVSASIMKEDELVKHNTGIYLQDIPMNPFTQTATIDYEEADARGFLKLDILNVHIYKDVRNEKHLKELMGREPNWNLLDSKEFTEQVFQIANYHDLLMSMKPRSVIEMAAFLAVIRPGKKHLQGKPWKEVLDEVWVRPSDGDDYYYKRSHAVSYAIAVIVHMNLLEEKLHLPN